MIFQLERSESDSELVIVRSREVTDPVARLLALRPHVPSEDVARRSRAVVGAKIDSGPSAKLPTYASTSMPAGRMPCLGSIVLSVTRIVFVDHALRTRFM